VDVVTFLPHEVMMQKIKVVNFLKATAKENYQIDAHFAYFCKWNHRLFERSKVDENALKLFFGFSRKDERDRRWPKGIIKINFLP
jgi:hypothetical protein